MDMKKTHESHANSEHKEPVKHETHKEVRHEPHKTHTTHTSKPNYGMWMQVATIVLLVILIFQVNGLGSVAVGDNNAAKPSAAAPTPSQPSAAAPTPSLDMDDLMDDDAVKGDKDAPVTIVEWSDYECPFCVRFYEQTLSQIDEQYIKTGKVKLVYRDFPLSFHPNAAKAGEAAECAGEQDRYFDMHDMLFEKGVKGGVPSFKQFAKDLGLDTGKFNACLDSGEMASEVAKDMQDGQAAGVRGTPGFIVNGQLVSGAQPFANFKQVIDAALAK